MNNSSTVKNDKTKVFLIDDDSAIIEALSYCLEDEGYKVKAVQRADHIVDAVIEFSPSIVLLDLFLAGQDGKQVAAALKADTRTQQIPIVMFSAHPSGKQIASSLGVAGYIAKPFVPDDLFRLMRTHLPS